MNEKNDEKGYKRFVFSILGALMVVVGITLVLIFWSDVVSLFKGISGMIIAIAGLTMLYFLSKN